MQSSSSKTYTTEYKSPIGRLTLFGNDKSLFEIGIHPRLDKNCIVCNNLPIFTETKLWLDIYFSGINPNFTPLVELNGTDFQKKVWTELLSVPFGQTATYGDIAKRIGCKSAQAIGQAVGKNPILIVVPCHRIIAANGKTGGFSAGIERKIWLLKNEGFEDLRI